MMTVFTYEQSDNITSQHPLKNMEKTPGSLAGI